MKKCWVAGIDNEKDIVSAFKESSLIRKRLVDICEAKVDAGQALSVSEYESPGWAYRQADSVGYRRALREVVSILS